MDIRKDFLYSVKEASDFTKWSVRKLQRYAKKNDFRKIDNRYLFSGHHIEEILLSKIGIDVNDTTTTENDTGGYDTNVKPLSVIEIEVLCLFFLLTRFEDVAVLFCLLIIKVL